MKSNQSYFNKFLTALVGLLLVLSYGAIAMANAEIEKAYKLGLDLVKKDKIAPPLAAFYLAQASRAGQKASVLVGSDADVYKLAFAKTLELYLPDDQSVVEEFLNSNVKLKITQPRYQRTIELARNFYTQDSARLNQIKKISYEHVGTWLPTAPAFAPPLLPGFGQLKTQFGFAVSEISSDLEPLDFSSPEFNEEVKYVARIGGKNSLERTEEQSLIAQFWAGGPGTVTPPGMWTEYALAATKRSQLNFHDSARLMLTISNALLDAAISCWNLKYTHDVFRPITAIQNRVDGNWEPLLATPPFPAYTSGHSTFSMAAATILDTLAPVNDYVILSSQGFESRRFESYTDAANEAGVSRIYGGIHYNMDNEDGKKLGRRIAKLYLGRYWGQDSK